MKNNLTQDCVLRIYNGWTLLSYNKLNHIGTSNLTKIDIGIIQ